MGQVYLAEDIKLGRKIALKVLPDEMASDPERLDRFQREARALAALDHPGIVTVHSVEEAGTSTGSVHFLTMNLVEGRRVSWPVEPTERSGPLAGPICEDAEALAL